MEGLAGLDRGPEDGDSLTGSRRATRLGDRLEELAARYGPDHLARDPLSLVHPCPDPRDQEVAGRFDLAIAQLGISRGCLHRRHEETCGRCPLTEICTL